MNQEIVEYRGIEGLVYAKVIKDTKEEYKAGEVKPLAGVAELSKETETNSEEKYYDNLAAIVVNSTGADTVTISTSAIPFETLADITGQYYDENLGVFAEQERDPGYFAIGYKTQKTNGDDVYVWRYKGSFNIPKDAHKTKTNGTDSQGQELTYKGINTTHVFNKPKKSQKSINVDVAKEKADVSSFFDEVTTIDTLIAKA